VLESNSRVAQKTKSAVSDDIYIDRLSLSIKRDQQKLENVIKESKDKSAQYQLY
jgi:hypothetical protein